MKDFVYKLFRKGISFAKKNYLQELFSPKNYQFSAS